jgi:hypothetical protein
LCALRASEGREALVGGRESRPGQGDDPVRRAGAYSEARDGYRTGVDLLMTLVLTVQVLRLTMVGSWSRGG